MSHSRTPSACSSHSWQSNTHYFPAVALQKLSTFGKASIFDCWVWRPGIVFLKIVVFEILRSPRFEENASPPETSDSAREASFSQGRAMIFSWHPLWPVVLCFLHAALRYVGRARNGGRRAGGSSAAPADARRAPRAHSLRRPRGRDPSDRPRGAARGAADPTGRREASPGRKGRVEASPAGKGASRRRRAPGGQK